MYGSQVPCSIAILAGSVLLGVGVAAAEPPGGRPGSGSCNELGLSGALRGLCTAYHAIGCHEEALESQACASISRNFTKFSGGDVLSDLLAGGTSEVIPPEGGSVVLTDIAEILFPAGAFEEDTSVRIQATSEPGTAEVFDEFASIFRPAGRLSYEVRINTGVNPPTSETVAIALMIPDEFLAGVPSGHQIELFAQVFQGGALEELDAFELFPSVFDPATQTIMADLPTQVFSSTRTADGTWEAVLTLAPTPGITQGTLASIIAALATTQQAHDECKAAAIGCPLEVGCTENVSSGYQPAGREFDGATRPHYGTDFAESGIGGTGVIAAADGTVERSYLSTTYGETVVIRHSDGGATLYAHMQSGSRTVSVGQSVSKGDSLGRVGSTGRSSGDHLHFEYVANGEIIQSKERIDPFPCIGDTVNGSITVRDNGSLADDAFEVFFDDVRLGATTIGGTNTLAVSNLRSGSHSLRIVAIIAPDNVGTYQVTLADGLTFSGGGTSRSGSLPQGGSVSFGVEVP